MSLPARHRQREHYNTSGVSSGLHVLSAGIHRCPPGYRWGGPHSCYLLHHVLEGKGSLTAGGRQESLGPGDSFLIRPGEEHYYLADRRTPWTYTWVNFSGLRAKPLLSKTCFRRGCPIHRGAASAPDALLYRLLGESLREKPNGYGQRAEGLLLAILSRFDRHEPAQDLRVERMAAYAQEHFREPLSIRELAKHSGLSRAHASSLFSKTLGLTLREHLTALRLAEASELLRGTRQPVASIADEVGYRDYAAFERAFRKKLGVTPSAFRRG